MIRATLSVLFYFVISLLTVVMNKFILSYLPHRFNFPLTMTWIQVFIAFKIMLVLCPLFQLKSLKRVLVLPVFELKFDRILAVIPTCIVFVGMISFNNFCLSKVNLTLYLVFKSLTVLFSMIFSYFVLGDKSGCCTIFTVFVVIFGYIVGVIGGFLTYSFGYSEILYGGITGIFSSIYVAFYSIFVKKTLKKFENNHWLLLIYMNFVSFFIFFVIVLLFEMRDVLSYKYFYDWRVIFSLIFSGICGFLINVSYNFIIKYTSPLTKEVTGTARACVQPIVGFVLFKDDINLFTVIGAIVCIFGSFAYSISKRKKKKKCCKNKNPV